MPDIGIGHGAALVLHGRRGLSVAGGSLRIVRGGLVNVGCLRRAADGRRSHAGERNGKKKTENEDSRGMGPSRGVGAGEAHATDVISFPCAASGSSKEGATLQQPLRQQPLKETNMPVTESKNIMAAQARRTGWSLPQMLDAKYLRTSPSDIKIDNRRWVICMHGDAFCRLHARFNAS